MKLAPGLNLTESGYTRGDRVRMAVAQPAGPKPGPPLGALGTIHFIEGPTGDMPLVEFDEPFPGGHNGWILDEASRGADGRCWFCWETSLSPAPAEGESEAP